MVGNFENQTTISGILSQFSAMHAHKWPEFHFWWAGQIFNPKFETPLGFFPFRYKFWWHFRQDLYVFSKKNGFLMQNFWNLGASGGENPWLISYILSH